MLAMSCKRRNGLTIGSGHHGGLDEVAFSWKLPCLYDATSVNLTASRCESGCTTSRVVYSDRGWSCDFAMDAVEDIWSLYNPRQDSPRRLRVCPLLTCLSGVITILGLEG